MFVHSRIRFDPVPVACRGTDPYIGQCDQKCDKVTEKFIRLMQNPELKSRFSKYFRMRAPTASPAYGRPPRANLSHIGGVGGGGGAFQTKLAFF